MRMPASIFGISTFQYRLNTWLRNDILRRVKYIRLSVTEILLFKRKREDSSSAIVKLIVQCNPEHHDYGRLYKNSPLT